MKVLWHKHEQEQSSRREEVYAALQYAASFHCLVGERKDCEEPKPQPKEKLIFVVKKREVRLSLQISVHEMWRRQQVHADERNMYRTEILGKEFGKME